MLQYLSPSIQFLLAVLVLREPINATQLWSFALIWLSLAVYSADAFLPRKIAVTRAMTERLDARTLEARLEGVFIAPGDEVASVPVDRLTLTYAGIPGDRHAGTTRLSGAREPWYPRGTPMRNERQLSILSAEELVEVAAAMAIPELKPEWIGASLLLSGIHDMSRLPPRIDPDVPIRRRRSASMATTARAAIPAARSSRPPGRRSTNSRSSKPPRASAVWSAGSSGRGR